MIDLAAPVRDWMQTVIYVAHRRGIPDVVMGRWPPEIGHAARYKTWICETPGELDAVMAALARPIPRRGSALDFRAGPDAAVAARARGMEPVGKIVVALYPPPADAWPWLVLLCVPTPHDAERGVYTWEALESEAAALDHLHLIGKMASGVRHVILPPETMQ